MFVYLCVWCVLSCVTVLIGALFDSFEEHAGTLLLSLALGACLTALLVKNGII